MEEPDPDNGTYYDGAELHNTQRSVSQLSDGHIAITTTLNGNNGKEKSFQAMFAVAHAGGKVQILSTEAAGAGPNKKASNQLKVFLLLTMFRSGSLQSLF